MAVLGLCCCVQAFSSFGKWRLLSTCMGFTRGGFPQCRTQVPGPVGSVAVVHALSCPIACVIKSVSLALADRFLTTRPPGESCSLALRPMQGHQLLTCKPGSSFHHPWIQHNDQCLGGKEKGRWPTLLVGPPQFTSCKAGRSGNQTE